MKKEYIVVFVIGLLVLSYVLDAAVNPLKIKLATPYQYFNPQFLGLYPFTTTSIIIKALVILLTPLLLLSLFEKNYMAKGISLFVFSALLQLYALQDIATKARTVPMEWSISFAAGGLCLLIPAVLYMLMGAFKGVHKNLIADDPFAGTASLDDED